MIIVPKSSTGLLQAASVSGLKGSVEAHAQAMPAGPGPDNWRPSTENEQARGAGEVWAHFLACVSGLS